jgi:hypothetical protein
MSAPDQTNPPQSPADFDEEFDQAVNRFRDLHKLSENDAVLLLVELFRIHQQHWDALRRREMPSFEPLRTDIIALLGSTKAFQQQVSPLIEAIKQQSPVKPEEKVTLPTAIFATIAALLGGYLIGRVWP